MTKILCAVDNTDHSKLAIAMAGKLARAFDAELTLLAVNQAIGPYGNTPVAFWTESEIKSLLTAAAADAQKAGASKIKTVNIESRDVPFAINAYAESEGYDHIVVGTGGKGAVSRMMLGSVSRDVVYRAHCPVTVVR